MWDFDNLSIWCINLEERTDRFNDVNKEFKKVGLNVNFHRPKKDPRGGMVGCFLSHVHCMKQALKENKNVLIFEDDVYFTDDWASKLPDAINIYKSEWDVIRLGSIISSIHSDTELKNVKIGKAYGNHAIMINISLLKKFEKDLMFDDHVHIDDFFHDSDIKEYLLVDPLCYQRPYTSDNTWFSRCNFIQTFMEHEIIFIPLQKINNIQLKYMSCLPIKVQEVCGAWGFLITLGRYLTNVNDLII
jgi:GR25 family glycosyltransferase involved in LPS biosynthesis